MAVVHRSGQCLCLRMETMSKPVLVVGAGPVGLTMAAGLARYGTPVRVVDRLPVRTIQSRALAICNRPLKAAINHAACL
ncbi:hypothetical protein F1542_03325 [Komagataeibacter sp. FXV3]|nr:hypothetical protein [Komagataeibacter sp. FXV3]